VAEKKTVGGLENNQADIAAYPRRPEIFILRFIPLMKTLAGIRLIHLEVEGGRLDCLLFLTRQFGEAVGKCVCDAEI
jgi:hypothetical protein